MSVSCPECGVEGDEIWIEKHRAWCEGVEELVEGALHGKLIEPNAATAHQFCEALNRVSQRHLDTESSP